MTEERLHAYSSPFNVGHRALENFWDGVVYAQEKVDGSQFSFGRRGDMLLCRSRNNDLSMHMDVPEGAGMFALALETVRRIGPDLVDGWTYRGEYLAKPKHNALTYARVPAGHIILFDVDRGDQDYLQPIELSEEAQRIGLETVPIVGAFTEKPGLEKLKTFLNIESKLGGCNIEGIVLKNYGVFGADKKVLMAKLVSATFREKHELEWGKSNPGKKDIVTAIIEAFATEARWNKAIQHRKEAGEYLGSPQDIGPLIREIPEDVLREEEEAIKDALFKALWPDIRRGLTRGFPEWFKRKLAEEMFGG